MGFWILLILCTILLFLIGFYILRKQTVEGFQKAPTFLGIGSPLPEVFLGNGTMNTLDLANTYCRNLGAELATYAQLGAASKLGANWTTGGFLLDRQTLFFPCDSNYEYVCSSIAVSPATQPPTTGPAICYGVKPSGATYTRFNTSRYSQWTEFPATATTGLAEVFLLTTGSDIASQTAASNACTGLGKSIRLATLGELQVAQQSGLHFCKPGWTSSDTTHVFNPVSYYESAVCNGNGVIQYDNGNIPTSGGIVWFDASVLTEETIKGGSIPSLFTGTGAVAVTVTGTPTLVESPVSNRNVLSLTASPVQSLTTRAFATALTSWTLAFVARQTGGLNKRVFQGISKNNVFGYNENKKQAFYMGDAASKSPWISPITTTSVVSATQSATPASDTAWDVVLITCKSTGDMTINWNGVQTPSISMGVPIGFDGIAVNTGNTAAQTSDCEIAEFIVYNTALGTADQTTILAYLNEKWITPLTSAEQSLIKNYAPQNFGPNNQRGAICMGPKPFPETMRTSYIGNIGVNSNFPLDSYNTYNPYQTLATNSSIQPFNRDIFSQRYTIYQYTSSMTVAEKKTVVRLASGSTETTTVPAHPGTMSNSEFKQQCSYLSTLGTITGHGFWLCDSDNAAKYVMTDPSIGPYDQVCVFVGDPVHTEYSCKDRTQSGKNADMIRYQSIDDLNTFCENTARLYMDLSGAYQTQTNESVVYISTISTMSSMQAILNTKIATNNCQAGTADIKCGKMILASTQVGNSINTLTTEMGVLGGISSISTIMSTVRASRKNFQCYNYGV